MAIEEKRVAKSAWIAFNPEFEEWWGELRDKAASLELDVFDQHPPVIPLLGTGEKEELKAAQIDPDDLAARLAGSRHVANMAEKVRLIDIRDFGQRRLYGIVGAPPKPGAWPNAWDLSVARRDLRRAVIAAEGGSEVIGRKRLLGAQVALGDIKSPEYVEFYIDELLGSDAWQRRPTEQVISGLVINATVGNPVLVPLVREN